MLKLDTPLKIEEFSVLLDMEQDTDALVAALSKLNAVEKPEDVTVDVLGPANYWYGWH